MSKLISREVVLECLQELCETKVTSAYGLQLIGDYASMRTKLNEGDCIKDIIQEISKIPTAYNVEKVVDELKGASGIQFDGKQESYQLDWCIHAERAIEIVKGGGVDE